MYPEEYIFVIGLCIVAGIATYDMAKEFVEWVIDEWVEFRLRRNYRKLYWFLEDK